MNEKSRLDYEQTLEQHRMLADIRFRLLAFVPTITGAALALLTGDTPAPMVLPVSLLGLVVTLGIVFYEVRNSQIYDSASHRAKALETQLDMPLFSAGMPRGGLFNERPDRELKVFGLVTVWHDRALALIYGPAVGGWVYLVINALQTLLGIQPRFWLSIAAATGAALLIGWDIQRLSRQGRPELHVDQPATDSNQRA